jgi:hypothetical protein
MTATLFQMGFRSGGFQPLPMQLGFNFQDFQNVLTRAQTVTSEIKNITQLAPGATPTPLRPPPPPAPAQGTILGLPSGAVLLGGALLLGGGVLAAVLLSRK